MKTTLKTALFPVLGFLGLVAFTLLGMWALSTGKIEGNLALEVLGYAAAIAGVGPAMLIIAGPDLNTAKVATK